MTDRTAEQEAREILKWYAEGPFVLERRIAAALQRRGEELARLCREYCMFTLLDSGYGGGPLLRV